MVSNVPFVVHPNAMLSSDKPILEILKDIEQGNVAAYTLPEIIAERLAAPVDHPIWSIDIVSATTVNFGLEKLIVAHEKTWPSTGIIMKNITDENKRWADELNKSSGYTDYEWIGHNFNLAYFPIPHFSELLQRASDEAHNTETTYFRNLIHRSNKNNCLTSLHTLESVKGMIEPHHTTDEEIDLNSPEAAHAMVYYGQAEYQDLVNYIQNTFLISLFGSEKRIKDYVAKCRIVGEYTTPSIVLKLPYNKESKGSFVTIRRFDIHLNPEDPIVSTPRSLALTGNMILYVK